MSNPDGVVRTKEEYRGAREWKYTSMTDSGSGASTALWTPASGKKIHLSEIIISVDGAGKLEISFGTRVLCHVEFDKRSTLPIELVFDIEGDPDEPLNASWTADTAPASVYITVLGEEV